MITNIDDKIYWIQIPKNGTQSIVDAIKKTFGKNESPLNFMSELSDDYLEKFSFGFAFIRDPLSRIISSWRHTSNQNRDMQRRGHDKSFVEYIDYLDSIDFTDHDLLNSILARGNTESIIIAHSIPSSEYLMKNGEIRKDFFIGRMENIGKDWRELREWIKECTGKDLPDLRRLNSCKNPKMNPKGANNPNILNRIYEIYKLDYENFGYEKSN